MEKFILVLLPQDREFSFASYRRRCHQHRPHFLAVVARVARCTLHNSIIGTLWKDDRYNKKDMPFAPEYYYNWNCLCSCYGLIMQPRQQSLFSPKGYPASAFLRLAIDRNGLVFGWAETYSHPLVFRRSKTCVGGILSSIFIRSIRSFFLPRCLVLATLSLIGFFLQWLSQLLCLDRFSAG
jgi:hypothetical protein